MFIEQPPWFFRALYPQAIFRMDPNVRAVYLTFDDGPIPEVTPWILDLLEKHHIKATFFMVGDNIRKHPDEYRMVVERGHRIGNHTFNHIRGFEYSNPDYLANAKKVDEIIHSDLFRPPHGHMGFRQYYTLRHHYRIIMWDLVTRDYSKCIRPEQVLDNVKHYVRNGSIITFHDSLKSWNNGNLQYYINRIIQSIYSLLSYHNLIFLFTFATDSSAESLRVVRGSRFYIEKTFTSVCHWCSKLRKFRSTGMTSCNEDVLLMCAYIHPCLALKNKERLRVLYISAWAFCVVRSR